MLIYGILFLSECLGKVKPTMTARDAEKVYYEFHQDDLSGRCLILIRVLGFDQCCAGTIRYSGRCLVSSEPGI